MVQIEKKSFDRPDEVRNMEKSRIDLVTVGNITFGRATFQPGWRWSKDIKPAVHTSSCQAPHTQVCVSGRLHVKMDDGTEKEYGPGDVGYIPPGHDGWVVGNEPVVMIDVTGLKDYGKTAK